MPWAQIVSVVRAKRTDKIIRFITLVFGKLIWGV